MSTNFQQDDDDDQPGFFKKYRVVIIVVALAAIGAGAWALAPKDKAKKKSSSVSMVNIMPPPPPPPPPPTPPPTPPPVEQQQEIPEDQPEFVEETQPDSAPEPESAPEEAAPLGTNIEGDGADSFGLQGKGGGGMIGGIGSGNKQGGNSKYGFYAGQVQSRVASALRANKKTRSATLDLKVRVWVDSNGRIQRAKLEGSTGNAALDRALTDEALAGLQLSEPPPQDMPMPIVMRISAKRPN